MKFLVLLLAFVLVSFAHEGHYHAPRPSGDVVFLETFDHGSSRWSKSSDDKYKGVWAVEAPVAKPVGIEGDQGLVMKSAANHHAIATKFKKPLDNTDKDLVIQYEVRLQDGLTCGGAYLKLVSDTSAFDVTRFNSDAPYTIMFGPDKCGAENKVHFILRHKNPKNGTIEEKHAVPRPNIKNDNIVHLYTLHIKKDNSYEISIDQEVVKSGNLLNDLEPAINPPKEVDDVTDIKPSDWVDDAQIADPESKKPDDWDEAAPSHILDPDAKIPESWKVDEPKLIPNPEVSKPDDWNDEEDGEFVAPLIDNPACEESGCGEWSHPKIRNPEHKGKWRAALIDNPLFKGLWKPRQVPNPDYFEDLHPSNLSPISGLGFELWTMTADVLFDNILITHSKEVADDFARKTWLVKHNEEDKQQKELDRIKRETWAKDNKHESEGLLEDIINYLLLALNYAEQHLWLVGASVFCATLPIVACVVMSPKKKAPAPKKAVTKKPVVEEVEEEEEEEEVKEKPTRTVEVPTKKGSKVTIEEEIDEEEEPEKPVVKTTIKKRTPKAN